MFSRVCQLNLRVRPLDLADHLGDVFCQLKIKKSLRQVRDRGRDREGAGTAEVRAVL